MYYHLEKNGVLSEYALVAPRQEDVLRISVSEFKGEKLRVWYKGAVLEVDVEERVEEQRDEINEEEIDRLEKRRTNNGEKEVENE